MNQNFPDIFNGLALFDLILLLIFPAVAGFAQGPIITSTAADFENAPWQPSQWVWAHMSLMTLLTGWNGHWMARFSSISDPQIWDRGWQPQAARRAPGEAGVRHNRGTGGQLRAGALSSPVPNTYCWDGLDRA